jgi:hypothetical protein
MRFSTLMAAFLFACGGSDTGGNDATSGDNGGDDDDGAPPINGGTDPDDLGCDQIPEFNTGNMDCDELWGALIDTVDAALKCHDASDCQAIKIACEDWDQANCYQIANTCITERDLDAFTPAQNGEHCDVSVPGFPDTDCECGGPPEVDCVGGYCDEKFTPP